MFYKQPKFANMEASTCTNHIKKELMKRLRLYDFIITQSLYIVFESGMIWPNNT